MNYFPDAFAHPPYQAMAQPMYYQQSQYGTYMHPQQRPMDEFYPSYPHYEYADFLPPGMLYEDYDDNGEVSSRPRLTKEQVEVLEAQFQAHPKPNSMVKRQLAMQTKLTLPRVANWFQNRRAKAKQQKKQEEFEISQALGQNSGSSNNNNTGKHNDSSSAPSTTGVVSPLSALKTPSPMKPVDSNASTPVPRSDQSKEATWLSLQRALTAAKAGQQQPSTTPQRDLSTTLMPPPEVPAQTTQLHLPIRNAPTMNPASASFSNWNSRQSDLDLWSPPAKMEDVPFDFGFSDQDLSSNSGLHESIEDVSPPTMPGQEFILSPSAWEDSLETPRGNYQAAFKSDQLARTSPAADQLYLASRRTSTTEGLSATLDNFGFMGSSPNSMVPASLPQAPQDSQLDIAARRKRPRPAALTSSALRSRSFGQLSSTATHSRSAVTPPAPNTIRHVKSTSHSLNQRYAGIRKASSASRSPMNIASFAEAEAFNKLMTQQAALNVSSQHHKTVANEKSPSVVSPERIVQPHPRLAEAATFKPDQLDLASRYQLPATQHLTLTTSPPSTPFMTDFLGSTLAPSPMHAHAGNSQFACFPEYTPPYSAGPLTSSSWSDAPLTSPELPNFPPSYLTSLNYPSQPDNTRFNFQQYLVSPVLRSDTFPVGEPKKTEFCIQEFPNQKEEHAHVAQQLAQQKPKSYVFANSAPSDFD